MTNRNILITVPFLPVLGAIHPLEATDSLLLMIAESSAENRLLPFDKSRRWSYLPSERIRENGIFRDEKNLNIITKFNDKTRLYIYGNKNLTPSRDYDEIMTFSDIYRAPDENEKCTTVFIDDFLNEKGSKINPNIILYDNLPISMQNFDELGDDPSIKGLNVACINGVSPTYVYVENERIIGAIGPMNILKDSKGVNRLLPCYFLVSPMYRKKGIGGELWQAMRKWAMDNGAEYVVLQAETSSPAEKFYLNMGLKNLGYVYKKLSI